MRDAYFTMRKANRCIALFIRIIYSKKETKTNIYKIIFESMDGLRLFGAKHKEHKSFKGIEVGYTGADQLEYQRQNAA